MWKRIFADKKVLFLLFIAVLIKVLALNENWVERYYTYGVYWQLSSFLRVLLGWVPFSVGDLIYFFAVLYLLFQAVKAIRFVKLKKSGPAAAWKIGRKLIRISLLVYVVFNIGWGLNYNRKGIAEQLNLKVQPYTTEELYGLTHLLMHQVNHFAAQIDTLNREKRDPVFINKSVAHYKKASLQFPFLTYRYPSIKPSLYSSIGHFFGFTGYYNPFSGEAQVKTSIPFFLKPFVISHEIAHQLGYAKENEANFVAFLIGKNANDAETRYSLYFELFNYVLLDYAAAAGKESTNELKKGLHPLVIKDRDVLKNYFLRTKNGLQPWILRFYDRFLKLNNQPKGAATYNDIIAWLIAYQKKFGTAAI